VISKLTVTRAVSSAEPASTGTVGAALAVATPRRTTWDPGVGMAAPASTIDRTRPIRTPAASASRSARWRASWTARDPALVRLAGRGRQVEPAQAQGIPGRLADRLDDRRGSADITEAQRQGVGSHVADDPAGLVVHLGEERHPVGLQVCVGHTLGPRRAEHGLGSLRHPAQSLSGRLGPGLQTDLEHGGVRAQGGRAVAHHDDGVGGCVVWGHRRRIYRWLMGRQ